VYSPNKKRKYLVPDNIISFSQEAGSQASLESNFGGKSTGVEAHDSFSSFESSSMSALQLITGSEHPNLQQEVSVPKNMKIMENHSYPAFILFTQSH
jgi:hypothetical protein